MVTKNEVKDAKNPAVPETKEPPVFLSAEVIQGCVQQGGKAATPAEAARLTAACVIEHLRIA